MVCQAFSLLLQVTTENSLRGAGVVLLSGSSDELCNLDVQTVSQNTLEQPSEGCVLFEPV